MKEGGGEEGERERERAGEVLGPVRNPVLYKLNTGWRLVFPGSSRLGIEPKTPGWLVQAQPIGGSDPTGIWCPGVCLFITQGVCLLLQYLYVFITAGPIIKLCAGGEGDSEGHLL